MEKYTCPFCGQKQDDLEVFSCGPYGLERVYWTEYHCKSCDGEILDEALLKKIGAFTA